MSLPPSTMKVPPGAKRGESLTVIEETSPSIVEQMATATEVAEYRPTEAGLQELAGRLANVVYDVTTPKGMEAARRDRRECVKLRTGLEAMRKAVKKPALEFGRLVDSEADRIKAAIEALEAPIDAQVKKEEERVAAALAAEEAERQAAAAAVERRIQWIRERPQAAALIANDTAKLRELADELSEIPMTIELYGDRYHEAVELSGQVMQAVAGMMRAAEERDRRAADLAVQERTIAAARIELDRQEEERRRRHQAEDAERLARQQREDAERQAAHAEEQRKREAEQERVAAIRERISMLQLAGVSFDPKWTSADIRKRADELEAMVLPEAAYDEFHGAACEARIKSVRALRETATAMAEVERDTAACEAERRELIATADPWVALARIDATARLGAFADSKGASAIIAVAKIVAVIDDTMDAREELAR